MNKNGFSEIFRRKEFAGSRAEKARGCFGSNKVSKIANMFSSTNLDMFLLKREPLKQNNSTLTHLLLIFILCRLEADQIPRFD